MSDDLLGTCISLSVICCMDIVAGICFDFMSLRHACAEKCCSCSCNRASHSEEPVSGEHEPLLSERVGDEPRPKPPMNRTGS